jgi:hypothetical protein
MTDELIKPLMADVFGIPEFFVTDVGLVESAGGGNVRVIRCIRRGSVLFPVFSLVTPMVSMILHAQMVREAAQVLFTKEASEVRGVPRH